MKNRYYDITDVPGIVEIFTKRYGIPELVQILSIYSIHGQTQINIQIEPGKMEYSISLVGDQNATYSSITIRNFKTWLNNIARLGFKTGRVGRMYVLRYRGDGSEKIELMLDSFMGNVVRSIATLPASFLKSGIVKPIDRQTFEEKLHYVNTVREAEPLINNLGGVHSDIYDYCLQNGIDIATDTRTIKTIIAQKSNDYSVAEKYYRLVTNSALLNREVDMTDDYKISPHSFVICTFNGNMYINHVLDSILKQNLDKKNFSSIEVIIIDDGSRKPIEQDVAHRKGDPFTLRVIRLTKNMGLATGRNIGLSVCTHQLVTFIDGDVVISPNFIREINKRLNFNKNAVYVAMRKNIMLEGYDPALIADYCESFDDSRVHNIRRSTQVGWENDVPEDFVTDLLVDTDYFKKLGMGAQIGIYTIANAISGHNISAHKNVFRRTNGFCSKFKGWGFEDTLFAAQVFANGAQIIPVLNIAVYHFDYGPRDGDIDKKIREAEANRIIYLSMLTKTITLNL